MNPNKIFGKTVELLLKESDTSPDVGTVREFLKFLKQRTQFRYEFVVNKKNPLLTVIPENAFRIYYAAFLEGTEEWGIIDRYQPKLNQTMLFPMQ